MNEANSLRRTLTAFGAIATILAATGAGRADDGAETFRKAFLAGELDWEAVTAQAAKEKAVNFYYWGGDDALNVWVDRTVAPAMKTAGVKLNPVRITSTKDAVDLVLTELGSGRGPGEGSVDLVWINGENFYTLAQQNALWGSFAEKLPNSRNFIWNASNPQSIPNLRDFGFETRAREIPWSGEQYVCAVNKAYVDASVTPSTFDEMKTYLESNPGKFTYVKPPHYVGNTFVQEVIYAFNPDGNGADPFQKTIEELGADELARLIEPGLGYLKSIEPLLASADGGKPRYPEDTAALDTMFLNGEIYFDCKFGLYAVDTGIRTGRYPETAKEMIFPKGLMIKNKNYLAIPLNSPNPASALVLANYMSSVEAQASKLKQVGMPAGIDIVTLSQDDAAFLRIAAPVHYGVTQSEFDTNAVADTNASLVDIIEATWLEYIERGSDKPIREIVADAVSKQARN
jgi:putative spermidine/putrescine transport system substrate-binding protein